MVNPVPEFTSVPSPIVPMPNVVRYEAAAVPSLDTRGAMADALVDLYYWADPVQGNIDLETIRERLGGKVAIAGGVNAPLTLGKGSPEEIRRAVVDAIEILGPSGFILEPVDALFPDTPWEAVKTMIDSWKELQL